RAGDGPRYVDLHRALLASKSGPPLYYRTDTHWNELGGLTAYRAAGPALGFEPATAADFGAAGGRLLGDLNRLLRLSLPGAGPGLRLTRRDARARRVSSEADVGPSPLGQKVVRQVWETGDPRLPRAVLFHDSFADVALTPALAEHFELLAAVHTS